MPVPSSTVLCGWLSFSALLVAGQFIPPGPTPHPGPTPSPGPLPQMPEELRWAVAEMGQFDLASMQIRVPSGVTPEHPTKDGITYPVSAIKYGTWVNTTLIKELIANKSMGSLFNSPSAPPGDMPPAPPVDWWRDLQSALYEFSAATSPILYGMDSVHGVNYAFGATLFPQQIGVAATFDPAHAFAAGKVTSRESRYIGIPWTFAPILGIAVQPSWPRVYETYGEDPKLVSLMADQVVRGMQQPPPPSMFPDRCTGSNTTNCPEVAVAACMKHFIGYTNSRTGRDRTPAWIPDNFLLQYFLPSFKAAVDAGVLTTMENYIEVNGRPMVMSKLYLKFLLREVLNFQGMLVTDYNEIPALFNFHSAARSYTDAVYWAINQTTIDMGMYSNPDAFPHTLVEDIVTNWQKGLLSDERILESAARVIDLKVKLGLIGGSPVPPAQTMPTDSYKTHTSTPSGETCFFGCPEHHEMAYNATRDSMTLLENDGILPLNDVKGKRVAVIGRGCNSVPYMAGGWTIHWQGSRDPADFPYGSTVLDEARGAFGSNVHYSPGCSLDEGTECTADELTNVTNTATMAAAVIVCVGEAPYAEIFGDIYNMTVPGGQIKMVEAIHAVNPYIVTVLIEGRPRVLGAIPSLSKAVLHAYLPGPFGGRAIMETLTGAHNPHGRLPITYPKYLSDGPLQYWRRYAANQFGDFETQWDFAHGIGYSVFTYSNIVGSLVELADIVVNVTVTNLGSHAGTHTVPLFITQTGRPIPAEVKRLVAVKKVRLEPMQTVQLSFNFSFLEENFYYNEVNCKFLAIRPTYVIVGTAEPFATPATIQIPLDLSRGYDDVIDLTSCPLAPYFDNNMDREIFAPSGAPRPSGLGESEDYFMSSVVCFVGGVIATVFLVFFVRRKNRHMRTDSAAQLFEPSGV